LQLYHSVQLNHPKIWTFRINYLPLTLVTQKVGMIISFKDKETSKIWEGDRIKGLSTEIQKIARRKLRMLNNSQNINDLMIPPSNRLEKLKGNLKDFYSIRINDQWRIVFKWNNGNAEQVKVVDYH
jgi:proteic killer suppression protein